MEIAPESVHYLSVLILIAVALLIAGIVVSLNFLFGQTPRETPAIKGDMYECGVPYIGTGRQQFSVRYYLIGIIFMLFDVEVVFLYPWAVIYKSFLVMGPFILWEMILFILFLLFGYIYIIRRGALDWD
jgi:NADH-quinone oxidoreductase subunit A